MRALGLDVGAKTIGVAVSDELGLYAHPRRTLARAGTRLDADAVAALVDEERAERVVVGLPLTLEGAVGPRAKRVLIFVEALRARLGVPVDTWDERFSTAGAARGMEEVRGERRKETIDAAAAAFILQGWLDAHRKPR